jgi:hypothetical protein
VSIDSITLTDDELRGARAGTRTHICRSTFWDEVQVGDVFWIREAVCQALDTRNLANSRAQYAIDCPTGKMPIPGSGHKRGRWVQRTIAPHKMVPEDSRYTLRVVAKRTFNRHDITWEEITAEGGKFWAGDAKVRWWEKNYSHDFRQRNPIVVGLTFEFRAVSILGVAARDPNEPTEEEKAKSARLKAAFEAMGIKT